MTKYSKALFLRNDIFIKHIILKFNINLKFFINFVKKKKKNQYTIEVIEFVDKNLKSDLETMNYLLSNTNYQILFVWEK